MREEFFMISINLVPVRIVKQKRHYSKLEVNHHKNLYTPA